MCMDPWNDLPLWFNIPYLIALAGVALYALRTFACLVTSLATDRKNRA